MEITRFFEMKLWFRDTLGVIGSAAKIPFRNPSFITFAAHSLIEWMLSSTSTEQQPRSLLTFINPTTISFDNIIAWKAGPCGPDLGSDPPETTFYDDENLRYVFGEPVKDCDLKRREWLKLYPSFVAGVAADNRFLLVTGSQLTVCKNPVGNHLQLSFFKNKVDYCRIHGHDIFHNNVLLDPKGTGFWPKYPLSRAAVLVHPESEWIWWDDSNAVLTDMEFKLPLQRHKDHNLVVHGWWNIVYGQKGWANLNAGIFLIRNCQWSLSLQDKWAGMGG